MRALTLLAVVPAIAMLAATPTFAQKVTQTQTDTQTAPPPMPGGVNYGDDSSQWARDGECDDRRFAGNGMAGALTWENSGRDATDCRGMVEAGQLRQWDMSAALAATQCSAINFGDDSGDFPNDNECDDMRFEGLGMASFLSNQLNAKDASDCRRYCELGMIALR